YDVAPGQITVGQSGVLDKAAAFGATAGRNFIRNLDIEDSLFAGEEMTLQIWVQNPYLTGADSTLGRVIAMQRNTDSSAIDWSIGVTATGALKVFGNNGGSFSFTSSALVWNTDVWYNIALVAET